jgi:hypothetical protein
MAAMMRLRWTVMVLVLLLMEIFYQKTIFSSSATSETKNVTGIQPGERLKYSINWMGTNAGMAILDVGYPVTLESGRAAQIISIARSNDFISRFFPVEDRVVTYMDISKLLPLRSKISQSEGSRYKNREMRFDRIHHKVREIEEGKETTYDIDPQAQDSLSVLYYFRTLEFPPPGNSIFLKVYEGGKNWDLEIKILGNETVDTTIGSFNTIKTVVMARFEGIFLNKGDITIWFTNDNHHIPVQMKSQVIIGSVTVQLVSEENELE